MFEILKNTMDVNTEQTNMAAGNSWIDTKLAIDMGWAADRGRESGGLGLLYPFPWGRLVPI